ncbi:MAG: type II toxin-antitoxin system VapC family toxin [Halobacteriales archaeon]
MADTIPRGVKVLTDVNILAIGLTENHPAYEDVSPWLQEALDGPNVLLVPDYYPLRAQYIMTRDFEVPAVAARNAVQSLLRSPARIVGASDTVLLDAYEISAENDHDVYDSFILALARATEADHLVTADRDFDALCAGEPVTYRNPIPEDKLASLARIDG